MRSDKGKNLETGLTDVPVLAWGSPPLALLSSPLAERLQAVSLPDWLAELLDSPTASASALTAVAWDRLPEEGPVVDRVRREVIALVSTHSRKLENVRIGATYADMNGLLRLGSWPARARNALLRLGVLRDPDRIASVTFGDVLDLPQTGVKTALEAAALLELLLTSDHPSVLGEARVPTRLAPDTAVVPVVRWGDPGTPVLPQALRRAFADYVLPPWLLSDLRLPTNATALDLDSSVWRRLRHLPPRAEQFFISLLNYRATEVSVLRVMDGFWPSELRPEEAPWPNRLYNALWRARLLDAERLERITFGDLLRIPAVGARSALDFAVIADAAAASASTRELDADMRTRLVLAAEEEWVERVTSDDRRFRDVMPPYGGSLSDLLEDALHNPGSPRAHSLAEMLPGIRSRADQIASTPVDIALVDLLKNAAGIEGRPLKIVAARLGWADGRKRTLQEVGDQFGITRERVRQIVTKSIEGIQRSYLPQIERAVDIIADRAPLSIEDAAHLLIVEKLATVPLHPAVLKSAAELIGYDVSFSIDHDGGFVLNQGATGMNTLFASARRQAGRVGLSNVEEVQAELAAVGPTYPVDAISRILHSSTRIEFLDDQWFWMPHIPAGRNRLRNITRRMLSVTPRLDLRTLRQGLRRRYRFMQVDLVPPVAVLELFYLAHPEFLVNDGIVEAAQPVDYVEVLGDVDQIFVEVLRTSPTGLMDRAQLEKAVIGRGVNSATFSVYTTYSPILDHPATNIWCLRGHVVDPAELEALRAIAATRTRQRRALAFGWDEDGSLWLAVSIGNVSSPVIGIPSAISRYVAGRRFEARTKEGTAAGAVVVDDSGTSWGYGPFLRRRGAEVGDALTLRFNLITERVTLSLGDDAPLVEESV